MRGVATRVCNETEGWLEPNLEDCSSSIFIELREQVGNYWYILVEIEELF